MPGGGQQPYESLEQAVVCEVREETGYTVRVVRFAALAEEIYTSEKLRKVYPDYTHRVKHIFIAELMDGLQTVPTELDMGMERCEWVALGDVPQLQEVHPSALKQRLQEILTNEAAVWLGTEYWNEDCP